MRRRLRRLELRRRRTEAGYVALLIAILFPVVFLGCAAVAVDTSRWYVEIQEIQKAADAAALAGVPYLPQDMPDATARAKTVAARNGFDDASPNVAVTASQGALPSQLTVTITTTIPNIFGRLIGTGTTTLTRSSTADYTGAAPMGSPCNVFGNEPTSGSGGSSPSPTTPDAQGANPYCSRTPQFWATVEGPETGKVQGDRYQTKGCEESGVDGCTGTTNDEYDPFGYAFVLKVQLAAVGSPINVQLFDPEFDNTGQTCESLPASQSGGRRSTPTFPDNNNKTNPYVVNSDAESRYTSDGPSSDSFCTGDSFPGAGSGAKTKHLMTTSFVLRHQTDSQDPTRAAVISGCTKQYTGVTSAPSTDDLTQGSNSYNDQLAQVFHNWTSLCTFTPDTAGNYFLQVRTNVTTAGGASNSNTKGNPAIIFSGNANAAAATGNTTTGEGANSFALRAVTATGLEKQVAVSGYNHMPIFVNSPSASSTFNLIQVLPGAAGQFVSFSYFDAGDAQSSGDVTVLPPSDATGTITTNPFPGGCTAVGGSAGTGENLSNCDAPIRQASGGTSKNNGKTETITIPIPTDYSCSYTSLNGCWYRVNVAFGSGSVHDVTTWNATIVGDPVRLIH